MACKQTNKQKIHSSDYVLNSESITDKAQRTGVGEMRK